MIRFIIIHFSITKISIIIIFHLKRMLFERSKTLNLNFYDSFFVSPDCLFGSVILTPFLQDSGNKNACLELLYLVKFQTDIAV